MKTKTIASTTLIVLVVALGAMWWWQLQASKAKPQPPKNAGAQLVGLVQAQLQDVPVLVEASGTVVSLNSVDIRPQVASTVREVAVKDGQMVSKGQLLFRFDDRAAQAELDKVRAQILRSQAQLADVERQHKRSLELKTQGFIAQSAVDTVQAQLDAQRASIAADQAALSAAQVTQSYQRIYSPLSGRAGAISMYPGSLAQPSSATALVTVSQMDPIGVFFNLPETQLAPLLQAQAAHETVEVQLLDETKSATQIGRVSFIDNQVDPATGTIRVRAEFANPKQLLWPGQFLRVNFKLRSIKDAVVIPQAAIILIGTAQGQSRSVYVVGPDQIAQRRAVQLRYAFGELAVVDGLRPGEKVVLEGKQNLRDKTPVREQPATSASAASRPAASGAAPHNGGSRK